MTDETETPDTTLAALQNPTPLHTLDTECIAVPKATIRYLMGQIETQALGVRNNNPEHYEALCHRLAELQIAYQAHTAFDNDGYGDPITLTIPSRALRLVLERAEIEYTEITDQDTGVTDEFLDEFSSALDIMESARVNTVPGATRTGPEE